MAKFLVSTSDSRPCTVKYFVKNSRPKIVAMEVKALFRMFNPNGDAIVEHENGDVEIVPATSIRFLDSDSRFEQYCWGDKPEEHNWNPKKEVTTACNLCKFEHTSSLSTPCAVCDKAQYWQPKEE